MNSACCPNHAQIHPNRALVAAIAGGTRIALKGPSVGPILIALRSIPAWNVTIVFMED
jgi:hypothetical protein